jgi:hypothetical protein
MPQKLLQVDPCSLRLPPSRKEGADDFKLSRQVSQFGSGTDGMPLIEVTRGKNGLLMINSGVTRATRVAKLLPTQMVTVEIIDERPNWDMNPTVGEKLR